MAYVYSAYCQHNIEFFFVWIIVLMNMQRKAYLEEEWDESG